MLYVCIPVHNEAATVGVLLWRLRTVLQDAGRDYEVVVYDDASTDATAEVLAPYLRVLPLTVLGGPGAPRRGRTGAVETLVRHVAAHSRHPRRDACVLLQGDFTDRAEDVPVLLAAFEQGADVVAGRRESDEAQPPAERRLRRMAPWVLRPLVRVEGVDDLLGGPRLVRVAVLRDLVRARGAAPLLTSAGWAGAAELLAAVVPFARRVAVVDTPGRYDVRPRPSRLDWAAELRMLARYAWRARGTHARPVSTPAQGELIAAPSPARPAAALDETGGTANRDEASRPERPRRARPARAPRQEVAQGEASANMAPVESQSSDLPLHGSGTTPSSARAHPAHQPQGEAAPLAGESPVVPTAERPQGPGRQRRARPMAPPESVDIASDAVAVPRDAGPTVPPAPSAAGPASAVIDAPALAPADPPELASPDSADLPLGRRRKRRPRRRARGAGSAGVADDAPAADDALPGRSDDARTLDAASDAASNAASDERSSHAQPSDGEVADGEVADDQSPGDRTERAEGTTGKRRRRRRPRGRSDERPSGVPPEVTVRDDDR